MLLMNHGKNTYVLKEINHHLNVYDLNVLINKFLKRRNELGEDSDVYRAHRHTNYIIVCGYASLVENVLLSLLKVFLEDCNINYTNSVLSDEDMEILKPFLPVLSKRKGDQHGGVNKDTPTIDPNVKALSDVFNTYKGIKTFSSCEGHLQEIDEANLYVLFTADTMEDLNVLTKNLWNSLEKVSEKYNVLNIDLLFDYGDWPSVSSTYFELRFPYHRSKQQEAFESMNYLAELLIKD